MEPVQKNLFNGMLQGFVCTYWGLAHFPWLICWTYMNLPHGVMFLQWLFLAPLRTGPNKGTKVRWLGPVKLCKTPIQAVAMVHGIHWTNLGAPNHSMPGAQEGQENMFATAAAQLCLWSFQSHQHFIGPKGKIPTKLHQVMSKFGENFWGSN